MHLIAEPLTAAAFAPYGDVLEAPAEPGRTYFDAGLANDRPSAAASLAVARIAPVAALPLLATRMERHEFSSQSFVPIDAARFIAIVAPKAAHGGPDEAAARAFVAAPGQGVTYHADIWHHPMTVLDRPARFAVLMWLAHSNTDEEFVTLDAPFTVGLPD